MISIEYLVITYYFLGVILMFILLSLGDAWTYNARENAPWNVLRSLVWPFMCLVGFATGVSWLLDILVQKIRIKIGR